MTQKIQTKYAVLGAGPGGYPAAFHLADHSEDEVTLIESRKNPGGVCVYEGCIPSKALLHIAHLIKRTKESEKFGVRFSQPKLDIEKIRAYKERVVKKLTAGTGQLTRSRKIRYIQGHGKFLDPHTLLISQESEQIELSFAKAIIATGSNPLINLPFLQPFLGSDHRFKNPNLWTSNEALAMDFKKFPKTILVIGGGYIGLELASVYQAFGSQVTVIERLPQLVSGGGMTDPDLVRKLEMQMRKDQINFLIGCEVEEIKEEKSGLTVVYSDQEKKKQEIKVERVLVSVGRVANSQAIDLTKAGINTERQFIPVNAQRQTEQKHICAIGDVAGGLMLAHKASHEGICAADHLLGKKTAFAPYAIPAVIYTDPEIATTGLSETEAKAKNIPHRTMIFPWAASGRATSIDDTSGFTKIIADPDNGRILGMGIVGHGAGELISEGTLAIEMAATARDLADTIHPHPTLSETIMEAAEIFSGSCTHLPKKPPRPSRS